MSFNKYIFFLLIPLLFSLRAVAYDDPFEKQVAEGVEALNKRILENEQYASEGNTDKINYIVDLRYELHKKLNSVDYTALNTRLTTLNNKVYANDKKIAFYVLLTTLQKPVLSEAFMGGNAGTDYQNLLKYFQTTTGGNYDELGQYLSTDAGKAAEAKYQKDLNAYTEAVYRKSLLATNTAYGALLNLHSSYYINASAKTSAIKYRAVLSLGRGLRTESVRQALIKFGKNNIGDTNIEGAPTKKLYDASNESAPLNVYLAKVESVLFDLGKIDNFSTPSQDQTLNEEETFYRLTDNIANNIRAYDSQSKEDTRTQDNVTIHDYSGIAKYDASFIAKVFKLSDNGGLVKIQDVNSLGKSPVFGDPVSVHIYVTSDKNTAMYNKYPRELLVSKENELNQKYNNRARYLLIGLHIYSDQPVVNGLIPMQVTTIMNSSLKQDVYNFRKEANNGLYGWFMNTKTGDIVFCNPTALNHSGDAYVNFEDWVFLGNRKTIDSKGSAVFNEYSDNYFLYSLLESTDDSDEQFELFILVVETEAAIILAVPTLGGSIEVLLAEQTAKQIIKKSAKSVLFSYLQQMLMYCVTSDDDLATSIGKFRPVYNDIATDVLTDIFEGKHDLNASLICLNGMLNKYNALSQANKEISALSITEGCVRDVLIYSIKEQAGNAFNAFKNKSTKDLVKLFTQKFKLSTSTTRSLLKLLGKTQSEIDAEIPVPPTTTSTNYTDQYSEFVDTPENLPGDGKDFNGNSNSNSTPEVDALVQWSKKLDDYPTLKSAYTKLQPEDRLKFRNDFSSADKTVLAKLDANPGLTDTWSKVTSLKNYRTDVDFLQQLNKAQNSHLPVHLMGEVTSNRKAVGCHIPSAVDGINIKILPNPPPVYAADGGLLKAKIEINGIPKNALSTFFPKDWDVEKVLEEVALIMKNPSNQINPRSYKGIATDGTTNITIRLTGPDNNLTFDTVFPD